MNEVMNIDSTILNGGMPMELLVVIIIVGILISFFGLKLVRVLTTIVGFVLGAGIGLIISNVLGWSGITVAIVTLGLSLIHISALKRGTCSTPSLSTSTDLRIWR